ncbi:MAG: three-Cys-motif partner protein TcmP [Alphaproteobacteria bacterium]|nr:three-Cys-motif partner protein TcmP [Alphaproteobacteria bacterium]
MTESYEGREQTETKHLILQAYLQSLIFKVSHKSIPISYIDGFSGPWESRAQSYRDTSFGIALRCLKESQAALAAHRKKPLVRAIFCEKNRRAFLELERFVTGFASEDFKILALNDRFENIIQEAADTTADSFRLTFVDPKGWTGFGFEGLSKLGGRNSEVLINFMYDHSNRFFGDARESTKNSFYDVFDDSELSLIAASENRESKAIQIFDNKLKNITGYKYVAHSRVSRPLADRTQFILFFGTNSLSGLEVFRDAEEKAQLNYAYVRAKAKERAEEERSRQVSFPGFSKGVAETEWNMGRAAIRKEVKEAVTKRVVENPTLIYAEHKAELLQQFPIRRTEINKIINELGKAGVIAENWKEGNRRKQVPPDDCVICPNQ